MGKCIASTWILANAKVSNRLHYEVKAIRQRTCWPWGAVSIPIHDLSFFCIVFQIMLLGFRFQDQPCFSFSISKMMETIEIVKWSEKNENEDPRRRSRSQWSHENGLNRVMAVSPAWCSLVTCQLRCLIVATLVWNFRYRVQQHAATLI